MLRLVSFAKKETSLLGGQQQGSQVQRRSTVDPGEGPELWKEELRKTLWNGSKTSAAKSVEKLALDSLGTGVSGIKSPVAALSLSPAKTKAISAITSDTDDVELADFGSDSGFVMVDVFGPGLGSDGVGERPVSAGNGVGRENARIKALQRTNEGVVEQLRLELQGLQEELRKKDVELADQQKVLQTVNDVKATLAVEKEEAAGKAATAESELSHLRSFLEGLQEMLEIAGDLNAPSFLNLMAQKVRAKIDMGLQMTAASASIESLSAQKEGLQAQVASLQTELAVQREENMAAGAQQHTLSEEIHVLKVQAKESDEKLRVAQGETAAYKEKLEACQFELATASQGIQGLQGRLYASEVRMQAAEEKAKLQSATERESAAARKDLTTALESSTSEVKQLKGLVAALETEKAQQEEQVKILGEQLSSAQEGSLARISKLNKEIELLKGHLAELVDQLKGASESMKEMQSELSKKQEEEARLTSEMQGLKQSRSQPGLSAEVKQLKESLASKEDRCKVFDGLVKRLKEDVKAKEKELLEKDEEHAQKIRNAEQGAKQETDVAAQLEAKEVELDTLKVRLKEVEDFLFSLGYEREGGKPFSLDSGSTAVTSSGAQADCATEQQTPGGSDLAVKDAGVSDKEKAGRWVMKHCVSVDSLKMQHELEKKLSRREVLNLQQEVEQLKTQMEQKDKVCAELQKKLLGAEKNGSDQDGTPEAPTVQVGPTKSYGGEAGVPDDAWKQVVLKSNGALSSPLGVRKAAGERVKATANVLMQRMNTLKLNEDFEVEGGDAAKDTAGGKAAENVLQPATANGVSVAADKGGIPGSDGVIPAAVSQKSKKKNRSRGKH